MTATIAAVVPGWVMNGDYYAEHGLLAPSGSLWERVRA